MIKFQQDKSGYKFWGYTLRKGTTNNKPTLITHRINGPACINSTGSRFRQKHEMFHNVNGPAVIYWNSAIEWWINDVKITKQLNDYCHTNNIDIHDYTNISKSDKLKLKIKFGLML